MSAQDWRRHYQSVMRLQLYVQMRIHETLVAAVAAMRNVVTDRAGSDGKLTPAGLLQARFALDREWKDTFGALKSLILTAQREAASIPFGTLSELHA